MSPVSQFGSQKREQKASFFLLASRNEVPLYCNTAADSVNFPFFLVTTLIFCIFASRVQMMRLLTSHMASDYGSLPGRNMIRCG